jgi:hypothetical protein
LAFLTDRFVFVGFFGFFALVARPRFEALGFFRLAAEAFGLPLPFRFAGRFALLVFVRFSIAPSLLTHVVERMRVCRSPSTWSGAGPASPIDGPRKGSWTWRGGGAGSASRSVGAPSVTGTTLLCRRMMV